jgi:predicted  nucleic acid-binding Zn-ribbon protein
MEKITKRDYFTKIAEIIETAEVDAEDKENILAWIDAQVDQLDARARKAAERAAAKRAASDEMTEAIADVLTDEPQTVEDIVAQLDDETYTKAKVIARLSKLIGAGRAAKEDITIEGVKGKKKAYTRVVAE